MTSNTNVWSGSSSTTPRPEEAPSKAELPPYSVIPNLPNSAPTPLTEGTKFDANKLPWDLLPWAATEEVVKVLNFGAAKYAPRNWEKGIKYGRVFAATTRHLVAFWRGEKLDPETGLHHLAHAACCVLFLLHYEIYSEQFKQFDDRRN